MGAKIQSRFPGAEVELIGGGRGDFIVTVDGEEVWNKNQTHGDFPNEDRLVASLKG